MAIITKQLSANEQSRLLRQIRGLMAKGIINADQNIRWSPGFCMEIQIVPKKEIKSLSFSKPEGFRVFLLEGQNIIAALDFLYSGKRFRFYAGHDRANLEDEVKAINALGKKYRSVKGRHSLELIQFILCPEPFLLVRSGRTKTFYQFTKGRIKQITDDKLRKHVTQVLENKNAQTS